MIFRCWRLNAKSSGKPCLIRVMGTWVVSVKWESSLEKDLHFMSNPLSHDSSQGKVVNRLTQGLIWVMNKGWFDSNKIRENQHSWFYSWTSCYLSYMVRDSNHSQNVIRLTNLKFSLFDLIRLTGLCSSNHTPKISTIL